jgi:methyl-accepting chemotaxis protein
LTTKTEEISTAVKTVAEGVTEAFAHAERLLESARNKAEAAAMHGWGGVSGNMEMAAEHLEGVVEQLGGTQQACETASSVLDEITDKMSSPEVVEHLVTTLGEFDTATGTAAAAIALVDEAVTACEAAGQESLPVSLQNLREQVEEIHERLEQLRGETEAERQHAETWSAEDEEQDGPPGN